MTDMTPAALFFRIVPHLLYPACGLMLFIGGRFDRRAGSGHGLCTPRRVLGAAGGRRARRWPLSRALPARRSVDVRAGVSRIQRRTRVDDAASWLVVVAAVVGGVLQVANLPPVQALNPALTVLARDVPGAYVAPAFFGPYCLLVLTGLAVLALRAGRVAAGERTRTWLFVGGVVAALAPHVEGVVEVAFPGTVTVSAANWISVLGSASTLAVPCLTMYAAIVPARARHPHHDPRLDAPTADPGRIGIAHRRTAGGAWRTAHEPFRSAAG